MAKPLPPKNDTGFWPFVNDYDLLVRLAREEVGKKWKGERLTVARDLWSLLVRLRDVETLKEAMAYTVAYWCDRDSKVRQKRLKEIAREKYTAKVAALVERNKVYLAELALSENVNA